MTQQIHKVMENKNINGSIVAGRDVKRSRNANDSVIVSHSKLMAQARKQAFWVSLITGILSSLIASFVFYALVH